VCRVLDIEEGIYVEEEGEKIEWEGRKKRGIVLMLGFWERGIGRGLVQNMGLAWGLVIPCEECEVYHVISPLFVFYLKVQ
jgi:hypothetical protein